MMDTTTVVSNVKAIVARLGRDESGATAIEYALIASLIAVACVAAFSSLGFNVGEVWRYVGDTVSDAMRR